MSSSADTLADVEKGINAVINRTHRQTRQLFSGLREARKRAIALGIAEDEHAIDVMFDRLVGRLKASKDK